MVLINLVLYHMTHLQDHTTHSGDHIPIEAFCGAQTPLLGKGGAGAWGGRDDRGVHPYWISRTKFWQTSLSHDIYGNSNKYSVMMSSKSPLHWTCSIPGLSNQWTELNCSVWILEEVKMDTKCYIFIMLVIQYGLLSRHSWIDTWTRTVICNCKGKDVFMWPLTGWKFCVTTLIK